MPSLRLTALLIAALSLAAVPAGAATHKASAKKTKKAPAGPPGPWDGIYRGALLPAPALSKKPCGPVPVEDFEIDRGKVRALPGITSFEGTVTAAGFLSGAMRYAGDDKVPFQGRVTKEGESVHIRAGVIDETGGCAWTMDLLKH